MSGIYYQKKLAWKNCKKNKKILINNSFLTKSFFIVGEKQWDTKIQYRVGADVSVFIWELPGGSEKLN